MKFSIRMSDCAASLRDDALAVLGLEVELDRALAAVGGVEIGGAEMAAVRGLDERRAPAAGVVAGALALDLDDVGAEVGEHLPGPGPGQDAGQFENADAGEWFRHRNPWTLLRHSSGRAPTGAFGRPYTLKRGSRKSRRLSPNRLKANTARLIAMPGNRIIHGASR